MNDRYLYRGRSVDNGAWVEGNRIDDGVTGQVFIHAVGNSVNESDKVGEEGCLQFVAFEVDPSTICQCTGLMDNNGKLIFENDIVSGKMYLDHGQWGESVDDKRKVRWVDAYAQFVPCAAIKLNEYEIIGNIIDNPELERDAKGW